MSDVDDSINSKLATVNMNTIFTIFPIILVQYVSPRSVPNLPLPRYDSNGAPQWFPRIIGGSPAKLSDFRSIVSIQVKYQMNKGRHLCGGTLIADSFVLTAAHCLTDSENGRVVNASKIQIMGNDISIVQRSSGVSPYRQVRDAIQLFVHPQYSVRTLENDIALIRVKPPFLLNSTFTVAALPSHPVPTNGSCLVAGWGVTKENGTVSPNLLAVSIDIIPTDICNRSSIYDGMIRSKMLCAGHMQGGRDSCQGDSGGGLYCGNSSSVTGVVSFGVGCGRKNFPGVYTNVHAYVPWIQRILQWSEHQVPPTPTTVRPSNGAIAGGAMLSVLFCAVLSSFFAT